MAHSPTLQALPSRFLIIGQGSERQSDAAVGARVAEIIAGWHLPLIKSLSVDQLTPELVNDLVATDYVIFVETCGRESCARTVQIDPIVPGGRPSRALQLEDPACGPLMLLNLTQQLYGRSPQAWLLQAPTESFDDGEGFSTTAQRGYDRAVRTIEQFLKTYQKPAWAAALQ